MCGWIWKVYKCLNTLYLYVQWWCIYQPVAHHTLSVCSYVTQRPWEKKTIKRQLLASFWEMCVSHGRLSAQGSSLPGCIPSQLAPRRGRWVGKQLHTITAKIGISDTHTHTRARTVNSSHIQVKASVIHTYGDKLHKTPVRSNMPGEHTIWIHI